MKTALVLLAMSGFSYGCADREDQAKPEAASRPAGQEPERTCALRADLHRGGEEGRLDIEWSGVGADRILVVELVRQDDGLLVRQEVPIAIDLEFIGPLLIRAVPAEGRASLMFKERGLRAEVGALSSINVYVLPNLLSEGLVYEERDVGPPLRRTMNGSKIAAKDCPPGWALPTSSDSCEFLGVFPGVVIFPLKAPEHRDAGIRLSTTARSVVASVVLHLAFTGVSVPHPKGSN